MRGSIRFLHLSYLSIDSITYTSAKDWTFLGLAIQSRHIVDDMIFCFSMYVIVDSYL